MPFESYNSGRPLTGIALGSGSARGWGHIGVLRALNEAGIYPDIVCGTSVGAMVGAAYVSGRLDKMEDWVRRLNVKEIMRYMDIKLVLGGGVFQGKRLMDILSEFLHIKLMEDLPKSFSTVATDLYTGREIWLQKGPVLDAVRASIALPGIFSPVRLGDRWLVDGGLINPVPVSLCRALGAGVVIAVNLNGDVVGRHFRKKTPARREDEEQSAEHKFLEKLAENMKGRAFSFFPQFPAEMPGLFDVLAGSINIMQDRITKSRMAGDPPDVLLSPRLSHIGLLEFDRAAEAIEEGKACVRRMLPVLKDVLEK